MLMDAPVWWFFLYFGLGLLLGTVLYRSDFCMASMVRDVFLFRDGVRLRHLYLAFILTFFLFLLVRELGLSVSDQLTGFESVSLLGFGGGLVFGFGMVLAGGCVMSTLYKMASGNLTYVLAFVGIIVGSLLYAEFFPQIRAFEIRLALEIPASLFELRPQAARILAWLLVGGSLAVIVWWRRCGAWRLAAGAEGYIQPWKVAIVLALCNLIIYLTSGMPLGISSAYAQVGGMAASLVAPEHIAALEYFRRSNNFGVPELRGYTEMILMAGIVTGALFNALVLREFRLYGLPPWRQGGAAFAGGILIALGARMAQGCNYKHLLGGLALFSTQSMLFVPGLLLGVWVGSWLLPRIVLR
ncbi:YeeE/YedE family protein [Geoalkalibacter halelectricus]|uniref:YeeE/YedE family protein n=1 Tax=Geoalkalibacter halelectricus TaxID=2847045 RepID=A0ABY5ZNF4_9BACT|nr:YeeE/YedE family protein [Geoalkalibacter halelectricus]MDO3379845.1 YeeE/YedE family protein [Geoalkalibacter halelectricus]UWZ80623.1 YeeE/YedE family protein [Geoalkalibacter halelectricus]